MKWQASTGSISQSHGIGIHPGLPQSLACEFPADYALLYLGSIVKSPIFELMTSTSAMTSQTSTGTDRQHCSIQCHNTPVPWNWHLPLITPDSCGPEILYIQYKSVCFDMYTDKNQQKKSPLDSSTPRPLVHYRLQHVQARQMLSLPSYESGIVYKEAMSSAGRISFFLFSPQAQKASNKSSNKSAF